MPFTVVFEGDIAKLPFNPMKRDDTAFGKVVACSRTDALDEIDKLEEEIQRLETALAVVTNGDRG